VTVEEVQGGPPVKLQGEAGARAARWLLFHVQEQGFFSYAILGKEEWETVLLERGFAEEEGILETARSDAAGAMLVVALRYAPDVEPEPAAGRAARGLPPLPLPGAGKPVAKVGRFARGNWYREVIDRLATSAKATATDMVAVGLPFFPPKRWHRFANSRFPEKALAVAAGLGATGRNGLVIAEASGTGGQARGSAAGGGLPSGGVIRAYFHSSARSSAVLLGLMLLPFDLEQAIIPPRHSPQAMLSLCGNCRRCVDACPSRALHFAPEPASSRASGRVFERRRCIQHYASISGPLPDFIEASWQNQLYGCDLCLEACPYFRPDPDAHVSSGHIGGLFDAKVIAGMEDTQLRALFRGSALDQRWIEPEALRRDATLAVKNC